MTVNKEIKGIKEITKDEAIEDYQKLKECPCDKIDRTHTGLKAIDYFFFDHRLKTKTRRKVSFINIMTNKTKKNHLITIAKKYKKTSNPSAYNLYSSFQLYYGTINAFRPAVAKYIYQLYKPTTAILDFSAGWGGRCLSAMSLGIPYIGIDSNKTLQGAYGKMVATYEPSADVKMIFKPAEQVDFSDFSYDLVFTSPPYFMLEKYEKSPEYSSKADFLNSFFHPVVKSVWKYLKKGGHMALNIPVDMYKSLVAGIPDLPKIIRRIKMPRYNRHSKNASKKQRIGTATGDSFEWIYVWKKD